MKFILSILFFFSIIAPLFAQQDPQFTQYMFNPLVLNPAYAGSREVTSVAIVNRNQWVNFDGAPVTQSASIHSPLRRQKIGVGFHFITDRLGPKRSSGILASYAYRIPFSKGKLSFGLRGGIYDYRFNWNEIEFKDNTDFTAYTEQTQKTVPTIDFGAYYYTKTFYAGGSWSHIDNAAYTPSLPGGTPSLLATHFTATVGKAFMLGKGSVFRPSLVFKTAPGGPASYDLNACFLIDEKLWLGAGYRSHYGMVVLTEINITRKLRFGYSYDLSMNRLKSVNNGSHELFIGYDFEPLSKAKTLSPRFF